MLLQILLLALLACQLTYFCIRNGAKPILKDPAKTGGEISFWEIVWDYLFNHSVPNYEIGDNWTKRYGPFHYIKLPFNGKIIVNNTDLATAKQIMSSAQWTNRFDDDYYIYKWSWDKPLGLLFGNGGYWKEARKLSMKLLHQLDFFRQENVERFILHEVNEVGDAIYKKLESGHGQATMMMSGVFEVPTLNVVAQVMVGKRFENDDPVARKWLSAIHLANKDFNIGTSIFDIFPRLLSIPFFKFFKSYTAVTDILYSYFEREVIAPRRKAGTYKTNPADFVDHFLLEIDRRASENPRYLTDKNLVVCLRDLVFAGTDTSNVVLGHAILHLSLKTQIQQKVQAEIDEVIGTRQPRYNDLVNMRYTQAVISEILRYSSPIPVTCRTPLNDSVIHGEQFPKGTLFAVNLYSITRDPETWSDPHEFQPERFLNDHGDLVNADKILPFGYGKRLCIGEAVARTTIFLFLVSLLQKFTFEISKDHPPPSMKNQIGLSRAPNSYHVDVRSRSAGLQSSSK